MTSEQKQTLAVLDELARTIDVEKIENRLFGAGYFRAGDDERTKTTSLVDLARADCAVTKCYKDKTRACRIDLIPDISGRENFEFLWLHISEKNAKGISVPRIERIYAREV